MSIHPLDSEFPHGELADLAANWMNVSVSIIRMSQCSGSSHVHGFDRRNSMNPGGEWPYCGPCQLPEITVSFGPCQASSQPHLLNTMNCISLCIWQLILFFFFFLQ